MILKPLLTAVSFDYCIGPSDCRRLGGWQERAMSRQTALGKGAECRPRFKHLAVLGVSMLLGACSQMGDMGDFGVASAPPSSAMTLAAAPTSELERATEYWGKELGKNPRDAKAALSYAGNLKALGRKQEALGVLQASYLHNSDNRELLSEYGRLALDFGQVSTAVPLLERADDPARPDWRIISARGTAMAKQGRYKEAIAFFERAKSLAPAQSSVLSNLALAYTLDGQAAKGEGLLRTAVASPEADPKVRQNLALVVGLQGRSMDGTPAAGPGAAIAQAPSTPTATVADDEAATPAWNTTVVTASTRNARSAAATGGKTLPLRPAQR
jgi:Flp pilus assembly protein TadD